jgi:hypothetical protein
MKKKKKVDKLDTIRALLLKRVEYHSKQLEELRRKLKQLDEVDAMLPDLGDIGVNLSEAKPGWPYGHLSLTDAVKAALIHAAESPKTLRELRETLVARGFQAPKSHFSESLNATLHRLAKQGWVTVGEDNDGRKTFVKKI